MPSNDPQYEGLVNGHVNFISQIRIIPIVGLSREAAEHTKTTDSNNEIKYITHITEQINAITIQPTSRVHDIGKWLIITKQANYIKTEDFIDIQIPRHFDNDIPEELRMPGFPTLRRTRIPLRVQSLGPYADTLKTLAKQGLDLPQITPRRPWTKSNPITFHGKPQEFPLMPSMNNNSNTRNAATNSPTTNNQR